MRASVPADAVCNRSVEMPNLRSIGPAVDIDELHTAIRDDDEPAPHDAVRHKQISTALGVPPRVVVATYDDESGSADREHHDDRHNSSQP